MKKSVKELTEGMQRLCAIANRIVAHEGEVSRIERDLLLEDLRRLYEVALRLGNEELGIRNEELADAVVKKEKESVVEPDEEMLSSTVMATMAAMGVAVEKEEMKNEKGEMAAAQQETPQVVAVEKEEMKNEKGEMAAAKQEMPQVVAVEKEEMKNEKGEMAAAQQETPQVVEPEPELVPEPILEPEPEPVEVPQMEEIENNGNSLLFDEVIIENEEKEEKGEMRNEKGEMADAVVEQEKQVEVKPEPKPEPEPEPKPEPVPELEHHTAGAQASLLDYLKRPVEEKPTVKTLGEKVTTGTHNLGEQLNSKKVSDLRTVININDKFSFMSELFHNNMKAYNDFILRLNAIDTRDEALMCVNEVSAQYKWDEGSLAVQSFYKVFDKKF